MPDGQKRNWWEALHPLAGLYGSTGDLMSWLGGKTGRAKVQLAPQAADILREKAPGYTIPSNVRVAPYTAEEQRRAALEAGRAATAATQPTGGGGLPEQDKFLRLQEMNGYLVPVYLTPAGNEYMDWSGQQPATTAAKKYPREAGQPETWIDANGVMWAYDEDLNDYIKIGYDPTKATGGLSQADKEQQTWERQYQERELSQQAQLQEQMIQWYREQATMQAEAERQQQLANLRANPQSWLEYASLAGETPAVQPWMLPLMPQEYSGATAGQTLPGWTAQGTSLGSLPALTPPSAQYMSRIGPSAKSQYYGYEQARTGATPEDVQWRQWSMAPPSGQWGGLRWTR